MRYLLVALLTMVVTLSSVDISSAIQPTKAEMSTARKWMTERFTGKQPAPPFSFTYGGKQSADLLKTWKMTESAVKLDSARRQYEICYLDIQTGLEVKCTATAYADSPSVEWVLHFKNTGRSDTPILENVQVLNANIGSSADAKGDFKLYYAEGSHEKITDFQPLEANLPADGNIKLSPFGGRSSDGVLPFFNLAQPDNGGIAIGVGWTGQWAASLKRIGMGQVNVQAGMEITHLKLHPGEEIRSPAILMLFWSGKDRMRGQNLLRQLLLNHYTPRNGSKLVDPPFAVSPHAAVSFEGTNEANMLKAIDNLKIHEMNPDYFWIDAGWYYCPNNNWAAGVGTWDADPARYPNGMKAVADAAHRAGMKFLLWFEPERVMPGTWLYENHPDWLLSPPADLPGGIEYMYSSEFRLLNLGNPEALAWLKNKVSGMIRSNGIDCYRNDFNLYPLYFWRNGEETDRQGMNEIRYITGLYDYFDTLRRENPGILLDNCASGGRRIDFETLRRALVLTRSDYLWDPIGQQAHTYGLAQWIPVTGIGAADTDIYKCRSGLGSHFTFAPQLYSESPELWKSAQQALKEYRMLKRFYTGDFYPLGTYSNSKDAWMAWQFNLSSSDEGVIQAFRRENSGTDIGNYRLFGLNPRASYSVTDIDKGTPVTISGRELMESGITIRLPGRPGAAIITYKRIKPGKSDQVRPEK